MLHVTNGDCTVEIMRRADVAGDIVPWRDVLHEPLRRPPARRRGRAGERVVLWFEHDLYDQLQLLQILSGLPDRPAAVELICIGSFPGRPRFAGLGELEPDELGSLWPVRTPVTPEHVRAARAGWDAFRHNDPTALARIAATPDPKLPFLAAALRRLLEELPDVRDGLARSERQLLAAIAGGARTRRGRAVAVGRGAGGARRALTR